jgi:5-(carboxyamino)imidazole ribonucleotide mutase
MFEYATRAAGRGLGPDRRGGRRSPPARDDGGPRPLPVLGVPVESTSLKGLDSLCSIVQMPGGIPVATFAIGKPGAINAGLFAASILALGDPAIARALAARRFAQTRKVLGARLP